MFLAPPGRAWQVVPQVVTLGVPQVVPLGVPQVVPLGVPQGGAGVWLGHWAFPFESFDFAVERGIMTKYESAGFGKK